MLDTMFEDGTNIAALDSLEKVQITSNGPHQGDCYWQSPKFKWILLEQHSVRAYMDIIATCDTIKYLEMIPENGKYDYTLQDIIRVKGPEITILRTSIEEFPPRWLSVETMFHCHNIYLLSLDTRKKPVLPLKRKYDAIDMPTFPSLRILRIYGGNYCYMRLMRLILNCRNLEKLYFDAGLMDYHFISDLYKKRKFERIETNLTTHMNNEEPPTEMHMEFIW